MSMNFQVMTKFRNQSHICVQCVTIGLDLSIVLTFTARDMMERTYGTRALTVRNVLLVNITWTYTWMFTAVNTSALNVEDAVKAITY